MGVDEPFSEDPLGRLVSSPLWLLVALLDLFTSLLENMRVNLSFRGAFSSFSGTVGFNKPSAFDTGGDPLAALRLPASGVVAVDLESPSWDFSEEAFEFGVDAGFVDSAELGLGLGVGVDMLRCPR